MIKSRISPPTLTKFGNVRGLVDAPIFLTEHWHLESVKALKRRSSSCPYPVASPGKSMYSNNNHRTSLKETLGNKKSSQKSEVIAEKVKDKTLSANDISMPAPDSMVHVAGITPEKRDAVGNIIQTARIIGRLLPTRPISHDARKPVVNSSTVDLPSPKVPPISELPARQTFTNKGQAEYGKNVPSQTERKTIVTKDNVVINLSVTKHNYANAGKYVDGKENFAFRSPSEQTNHLHKRSETSKICASVDNKIKESGKFTINKNLQEMSGNGNQLITNPGLDLRHVIHHSKICTDIDKPLKSNKTLQHCFGSGPEKPNVKKYGNSLHHHANIKPNLTYGAPQVPPPKPPRSVKPELHLPLN